MKVTRVFICLFFFYSSVAYSQTGLLTINTSNNITLPGGNYIVKDPLYDEGALTDIGIVSLYDGTTNALISTLKGANSGDMAGEAGIAILGNGNLIVLSKIIRESGAKILALTFMKNNIVQDLTLNSINSIFKGYTVDFLCDLYSLPNGNFLINYRLSHFYLYGYGYDNYFYLVKLNESSVFANGSSLNTLIYAGTYDTEAYGGTLENGVQGVIIFSDSKFVVRVNTINGTNAICFDGNSNDNTFHEFYLGQAYTYGFYAISGSSIFPIFQPRKIKEISIIDENTYMVSFVKTSQTSIPIRLNALNFESPQINVIANTNIKQSETEPFLLVTAFGTNPIEENQYTAKVWLNESNAFVTGGKTYLSRHFEISPISTLPDITARVKLYFTQAEFDSYNSISTNQLKLPTRSDDTAGKHHLQIIKYSGVSNTNYGLPNSYAGDQLVINPIDTDIIWNGSKWEVSFNTKGFSGFFVSTEFEMPLPLSLESLTVKHSEKGNELNWQTSNETGSQYFDLERSLKGAKFDKIGQLSAQNNKETNYYHFIDPSDNFNNPSEIIYYRLKIQDFDGKYTYSKIVSIQNNLNKGIFINPNPVANKMNLYIGEANLLNSDCQIINILGQKMHEFKLIKTNYELDVSSLPIGIYYLLLKDGKKIKFIKN